MFTCDQFILFLAICHIFAYICIVVHDKKKYKAEMDAYNAGADDWTLEDIEEIDMDPELLEKKRAAELEIYNCDTLIAMYEDLYRTVNNELTDSLKPSNVIKYKRQLATIENKIASLQTKREKAYFIAYEI